MRPGGRRLWGKSSREKANRKIEVRERHQSNSIGGRSGGAKAEKGRKSGQGTTFFSSLGDEREERERTEGV